MWTQTYQPFLGNLALSALVAAVPILYYFWALAYRKTKGHIAGWTAVALTLAIAIAVYHMPLDLAALSFFNGAAVGLFPIGWIIIAVVFIYKLTVKAGKFDIIRSSIVSITDDHRLQALLIAYCFGSFLEGSAGFGTPVAITAALLTGLGFRPLYAAGLCLITNTAPVAFGAIGIPITAVAKITGLDPMAISMMVGRQLPFLSFLVPFWLVFILSGWKGTREVMPAILVTGGTFALVQFLSSNFLGPELPDILSSLASIAALVLLLRTWKPKRIFRLDEGKATEQSTCPSQTASQIFRAWLPFLILTGLIVVWSIPAIKEKLESFSIVWEIPGLHQHIIKVAPIVSTPTPYKAVFQLDWLASPGTAVFIAAFLSLPLVEMKLKDGFRTLGETLVELRFPLFTVVAVLGLAFLFNYSGMSSTLGLAMAASGKLFPFFSPVIGWLGVFLTGSDTSSNALFGNLQAVTARQIGVDPVLAVAANSSGGVTGKMISPQSIAVATASTGLVGKEGDLFRFTVKHSLLFVAVTGIITLLQAYVLEWMIP